MPDLLLLGPICLVVSALCSVPALVQISKRSIGKRSQNPYSDEGLYQDEDGVEDGVRRIGAGKLQQFLILVCSIAGLFLSVVIFINFALQDGNGNPLEPGLICGNWV